jgi:hypothetical protein
VFDWRETKEDEILNSISFIKMENESQKKFIYKMARKMIRINIHDEEQKPPELPSSNVHLAEIMGEVIKKEQDTFKAAFERHSLIIDSYLSDDIVDA